MSAWTIERLEAFIRGVPRRVPAGSNDTAVAARTAIEGHLAELNAAMLGRDVDHRVPVDLDAMVLQVADRMDRYTSADWSRNDFLSFARQIADELAAVLQGFPAQDDDEDDD